MSNPQDPQDIANDTPATATELGSLGFAPPANHFNFYRFDEFGPVSGGASDRLDHYRFVPLDLASVRVAVNPIGYDQHTHHAGAFTWSVTTQQGTTSVAFLWDGGNRDGTYNDLLAGYRVQFTHVVYENFDNFKLTLPVTSGEDVLLTVSGVLEEFLSSAPGDARERDMSYRIDIMPDTARVGTPGATPPGTGTAGNDHVSFNSLQGRSLDGGAGIDTITFQQESAPGNLRSHWTVRADAGGVKVQELQFPNVERLHFSDVALAFDLDGNAGAVARLLGAVFGPSYVHNRAFAGIGLSLMDSGVSASELAALAVATPVFRQLVGGTSHEAFVTHVYRNVIGSTPSQAALDLYVGMLASGSQTQGSLALAAANLAQNALNIDIVGLAASGLEYTPAL